MTTLAAPPPGLIAVAIPKAILLLTFEEYRAAITRGKQWKRRTAMAGRDARPGRDTQPEGDHRE